MSHLGALCDGPDEEEAEGHQVQHEELEGGHPEQRGGVTRAEGGVDVEVQQQHRHTTTW